MSKVGKGVPKQMAPEPAAQATPEQWKEALVKDRGCCFLVFYHASRNLGAFQRVTVLCEECRIEWLLERIGELGLQVFPIGLKPVVEVARLQ